MPRFSFPVRAIALALGSLIAGGALAAEPIRLIVPTTAASA